MAESHSSFIFVGAIIHSLTQNELDIISNGAIVICGRNIKYLCRDVDIDALKQEFKIRDEDVHVLGKDQFLIPGFIDTHTHAPQFPNSGLGYDMTLLDWLETYTFPLEKKFKDEDFALRVYDATVQRLLKNGTTTATYFATIHESSVLLAKSAHKYGQRAFVGKVNMTKNSPPDYIESFTESLEGTKTFIQKVLELQSDLIMPIITPRFALSCDMDLMKSLSMLSMQFDIPIQTHVSENKAEIEKVSQEYPESNNYVDVYNKAGLVTDKTILAHGIYLDDDEISVIKQKKATVSHCPNSNILLQSGLCRVRKLLNAGVNVSLGTDCSGGCNPSMLNAIRLAIMSSIEAQFNGWGNKLSYEEVFYMATLAGAKALSIGHITGNFEVGKEFDAIVVDIRNNDAIDMLLDYSTKELFQKFLYLGDDRMVKRVFVAGNEVKLS